jgi:hypothetical protein
MESFLHSLHGIASGEAHDAFSLFDVRQPKLTGRPLLQTVLVLVLIGRIPVVVGFPALKLVGLALSLSCRTVSLIVTTA